MRRRLVMSASTTAPFTMFATVAFFAVVFLLSPSTFVDGQECYARFNRSITGYCSAVDKCQGTVLAIDGCGDKRCCVSGSAPPASPACITGGEFNALYSTPRAAFLRRILNRAVNEAGICSNCYAKVAFLAVSAVMTNDFTSDELDGTNQSFDADDEKYGNEQAGDGSRFRRRGFFGLRGRTMYQRLQTLMPEYRSVSQPESVALVENAMKIAARLWNNPNLLNGTSLTRYTDASFYGFSMLWYQLGGELAQLPDAMSHYAKFLRAMKCSSDPYPGEGPICQYNATHYGTCTPDCLQGLVHWGDYCGCSSSQGSPCPDSPAHIRCCLNTCSPRPKLGSGPASNDETTEPEPCVEPITVTSNSTIIGEVGKDKYKFFKIKIQIIGNQISITLVLFNGNVQLFFSFSNRNPQEADRVNDIVVHTSTSRSATRARNIVLPIDLPANKPEFVYLGVKGVDDTNQFEVKYDDCTTAGCPLGSLSSAPVKLSIMLLFLSLTINILL